MYQNAIKERESIRRNWRFWLWVLCLLFPFVAVEEVFTTAWRKLVIELNAKRLAASFSTFNIRKKTLSSTKHLYLASIDVWYAMNMLLRLGQRTKIRHAILLTTKSKNATKLEEKMNEDHRAWSIWLIFERNQLYTHAWNGLCCA